MRTGSHARMGEGKVNEKVGENSQDEGVAASIFRHAARTHIHMRARTAEHAHTAALRVCNACMHPRYVCSCDLS